MGLLDLPAPLFGSLDAWLAHWPAVARLALWGCLGGAVSMWLYGCLSPQSRIAQGKREQRELRERLDTFDGEMAQAWPLIGRLLGSACRQVGRVTGPAVAASLPVLMVMVWVSTVYGHRFPADGSPAVTVVPGSYHGRIDRPDDEYRLVVAERGGQRTVADLPLPGPITVLERRHWWNTLVANPAGYLDPRGPIERIEIALPQRVYLPAGPAWMRGWAFTFFAAVIVASLVTKRVLRIE